MTLAILQAVATANRRGAEVFAVDLARALRPLGVDATTVALVPGAEGARIDARALGHRRLAPSTLLRLRSEIRGAGVVVGHGSSTLPAVALAGAATGVPFVYRSIGDPRYWARRTTTRWRVGAALRRAAAVVALTDGAARVLEAAYGVAPEKIHVIPKAVPGDRFPPVDDERRRAARSRWALDGAQPVIAYVGALGAEKNVSLAIRAVQRVPDASLMIAGDGPERVALERLAAEVAPGRVRFLGAVPNPAAVLAAADAVVLSSATEGLPGVLMEAGLTGLPAVTTDVGWVREIVVHEVTGFVVPPDDPAALASALAAALADGAALGAAARRHCLAHFEIGPVADRWAALVGGLASAGS